ncbi:bacteriohemerythrin [Desulfatibacillum aliphaticivorans]|uniref:bacteriohemerythrin n=1 Tax=Desulfatibacillum aliphaticivorans TaxID=218208 RepID=UPI0004103CB5|nr:bacteriohemerythrin [Desulfatibacillum aliphaticivorans]
MEVNKNGAKESPEHLDPPALDLKKITLAYSRFVPPQLVEILEKQSILDLEPGTQVEREITILFSDVRGFTTISEELTPQRTFELINAYFRRMEPIIFRNNGFIDKYIGDAIMAIFPKSASDALHASIDMLTELRGFNKDIEEKGFKPLQIGIGLNTGISMIGTVGGRQKMEGTVISDAVNLASRLESLTKAYGVPLLISEHTLYSLDDAQDHCIRFIDRVRVKGKSRPQCIFEIYDADIEKVRTGKTETLKVFEEAVAYYHYRDIDRAEALFQSCLHLNPNDFAAKLYLSRCDNYRNTGVHESTGELDKVTFWKDEYNIGIPHIDAQHMELLEQINRLSETIGSGAGEEEIANALNFVDKYVNVHFKTEERLMEEKGYPFLKEHQNQHRIFYQCFLNLKSEMDDSSQDKVFLLFRTQIFLVDWLINHTTKTDKHLGKFLREQEASHG